MKSNSTPSDASANAPAQPPVRQGEGETKPARSSGPAPRLPHEHDESADSQRTAEPAQTEIGATALDDVDSGKTPTDRSAETDQTYNRNFKRSDDPPRP